MKTGILQFAIVALAGIMAVAQEVPAPPAPAATPQVAPAPPAKPARPRVARPPPPPRPAVVSSRRPYLGVDIDTVTPERAVALKLKQAHGVEITMVDQDAPAGKAGLREHDVITSFNGKPVTEEEQLREMIGDSAPGSTVALGISRDGQNMTVNVKLAQAHEMYSYAGRNMRIVVPPINVRIPDIPDIEIPSFTMLEYSRRNGLMVENLSPQLGDFFGVRNGEGVLVRSVEKGSAADNAGFRAGDVIVRAGNERVLEMSDWNRIVREHTSGALPVVVMRDKREQTISLNIPARSSESSTIIIPGPDMERLQAELNRLGPEWQRNQALMAQRLQREIQLHQKDWQQEMEKAQRELQRSLREMQRSLERQHQDQNDNHD